MSDNILARGMITFPLTITGLPKSQGTDYIFVVNDTFSKDAHSSHCVILLLQKLLLKQLLCIMEFILSIVSDQDLFFSIIFGQLFHSMGALYELSLLIPI